MQREWEFQMQCFSELWLCAVCHTVLLPEGTADVFPSERKELQLKSLREGERCKKDSKKSLYI